MMSPSLVSSLIASLGNAQHDWHVVSAVTHSTPSYPGLTLDTGGVTPTTVTGPASDPLVDKTYQLQSGPLDLVLVIMAHLRNGTFEDMTVYYRGTGFETDSVSLYNAVVAMADPEVATIEAAFEAMIRKKFATASLTMTAAQTSTGVKV